MSIQIITLFPELFMGYFDHSMMLKAKKIGLLHIEIINLRDFGVGPRKQVDDTPYGGGDGMLLKPEPLAEAINFAKNKDPKSKVILMTPRGKTYIQKDAETLAQANDGLIIVCGRYEGYDERIVSLVDLQYSIGDYVLTGGELPAMVIVDSVTRLIPGVLGGESSAEKESFSSGLNIEYPQYTRPEVYNNQKVPDVLLSGNHAEIEKWRAEQSAKDTRLKLDQDSI